MLYQLRNGKTIEMSIDQYLKMSDDALSLLLAANMGGECNDPFMFSSLKYDLIKEKEELHIDYDIDDLPFIMMEDNYIEEDFISLEDLGI